MRIATCSIEALPSAVLDWGPQAIVSAFSPRHPVGGYFDRPHLLLPCRDTEDGAWADAPGRAHLAALLDLLDDVRPHRILVQCTAGLSRSPALALVAAAWSGRDPAEACAAMRRAVPQASPNLLMLAWGDALLGLGGTLDAAAAAAFEFRRDDLGAVGDRTGFRELGPQTIPRALA
ncbi:hypothetical protein [Methylobacterium sp. Leaf112]|uniref:hypothetical protein n=1 Tax=Methylobacterium sp. Leaf112 TaxID=1736258 RepID=UPI000AEF7571|nr:hypothetical protein [Methylobacterium sp. Leaf112]